MTPSSIIDISSEKIISWMNVIREHKGKQQSRILENFWESQLKSKAWAINCLKENKIDGPGDAYIFGGWYGILASLVKDKFFFNEVYSIDIDPECKIIGPKFDDKINFITRDMRSFHFDTKRKISLIVNTSTEHVSQTTFDVWLQHMPPHTPILLQGNNFFECGEHVRCSTTIDQFKKQNPLDVVLFEGELNCGNFTRFMTLGYKLS